MRGFLSGVLPPKPGDLDGTNRWQWAVWIKLWLLISFAFWTLDFVPGFPGLARAEDLQKLAGEIRGTRVELLESSLFDLRVKQCDPAIPLVLRRSYGEQVAQRLRAYYELTETRYELPACEMLR